jgi:membrane-bound metal-dependent hydrolase YbcI (DUF457 family)
MRQQLMKLTEKWHMSIHIIFGLVVGYLFTQLDTEVNLIVALAIGVVGSLIPDLDHFLFIFVYGKDTQYARYLKDCIRRFDYKNASAFAKQNHKSNHYILSHNIVAPILSIMSGIFSTTVLDSNYWGILWFAIFTHFLFDILEDLLHHNKLNPNWTFDFKKPE